MNSEFITSYRKSLCPGVFSVTRRLLSLTITAISLGFCTAAAGQTYVADNLKSDSIAVHPALIENGDVVKADTYVEIANGEEMRYVQGYGSDYKTGDEIVVEHNGSRYVVTPEYLRFASDGGSGNVAQTRQQAMEHSAMGHFFYTPAPFALVFLFTAASGLCLILARRRYTGGRDCDGLLKAVPAGLVAASIVELLAMVFAGGDVTWWCEPDNVGYMKSIIYAFPAMAGIGFQILVGVYYKRLLEDMTGNELSWRSVFIGVGVALPLAIVVVVALALSGIKDGTVQNIVTAVCFLGALTAGFLYSLVKNRKRLGARLGMLFTSFSFVYAVGVIFAAALLALIVFKLLLTLLLYLAAFIGAMVGLGTAFDKGGSGSNGGNARIPTPAWQNDDGTWSNGDGKRYERWGDAAYKRR